MEVTVRALKMRILTKFVEKLLINHKLIVILVFSSITSVLLTGLVLLPLESNEFKNDMRAELSASASIIGDRSNADFLLNNKRLALQILTTLKNRTEVQIACLFDTRGSIVMRLKKPNYQDKDCPPIIQVKQSSFLSKNLDISQAIKIDNVIVGTITIYADLSAGYWNKFKFTCFIISLFILVWVVTYILSKPLLKLISPPIQALAVKFPQINLTENYSLPAQKAVDDELGFLVEVFNGLIAKVERQNTALQQAKSRYSSLYDENPSIVFNLDKHGNILAINQSGANQLGFALEECVSQPFANYIHHDDIDIVKQLIDDCTSGPENNYKQEFRQLFKNGNLIWVRATGKKVCTDSGLISVLLVCEDITETRLLNEKISYQATHDPLTGLYNRREFEHHLKLAVTSAQSQNKSHALCLLNIDQFKIVNDTCGHLVGDKLLIQVGELLKSKIRHTDIIARLGGDEFGILLLGRQIDEAQALCEKLCKLIKNYQFIWEDKQFSICFSIGITPINANCNDEIALLQEADTACFVAKDRGSNRAQIFHRDDEALLKRSNEIQWIGKIQQGLILDHFCLYGQPIIDISKNDPRLHFEVLLRYQDKFGRITSPGAFLPAAERYKLAPSLDRWVIKQLFAWLAQKDGFLDNLSICSINLSGLSLTDETMLSFIFHQFKIWDIPANKICFEITETAAIANLSYATNFIQALQNKGCLFSLDDFGSGLSSFAYLKSLPVDFLKIDGLFVKDILDDHVDLAMVRSINEVGHITGKKTIAEFVENVDIFNLVSKLGLDYAQGYGFSKPVPLDQLAELHVRLESLH